MSRMTTQIKIKIFFCKWREKKKKGETKKKRKKKFEGKKERNTFNYYHNIFIKISLIRY